MTSLARCKRIFNSYQITARGLFSLLLANSCFSLYYAQRYSLRVLRKLTELEEPQKLPPGLKTHGLPSIRLVRSGHPGMSVGSIMGNPYNQADIDRLERIQRRAARFIGGDYRSAREPGCVNNTMLHELDLSTLSTGPT